MDLFESLLSTKNLKFTVLFFNFPRLWSLEGLDKSNPIQHRYQRKSPSQLSAESSLIPSPTPTSTPLHPAVFYSLKYYIFRTWDLIRNRSCTANNFGLMYSRKRISQNSFPILIYIIPKSFTVFCQELL